MRWQVVLLWPLLALFLLRVAGQAAVLIAHPAWLPRMEHWYSGVLSYRVLLPAQLLLAAVMGLAAMDLTRGSGVFAERRPDLGVVLLAASVIYAVAMAARAWLRITQGTGHRWYEAGTIPTAFHFVLAAFLFTFASWHIWG